jgi:HEAT repeat protein
LIDALGDRLQPIRHQAAIALGKLGPLAKPAVPALKKALADKTFAPQVQAAEAIWRISDETELPLKVLQRELRGTQVPLEACQSLGRMGPAAKSAIPTLVQALKSKDGGVRQGAAEALGQIGKDAKAALPELKKLTGDIDPDVQAAAKEAIKRIDP